MRWFKSGPRSCVAVIALLLVLLGWAVSSPPGASPDDDYHLASSYCSLGNRPGLCEAGNNEQARLVPTGLLSLQNCYSTQSVSAACLDDNFEKFEGSMTSTNRLNTDNFYPALFYWSNGFFVSQDIQDTVLRTRVFNLSLVIFLFGITYLVIDSRMRAIIPITLTVCSVPLGLFLFASNNPSSWSISSLFCYALLIGSLRAPLLSRENLKLIPPLVICSVIAIGSRPDSVYFLPIITLGVSLFLFDGTKISIRDFGLLSAAILVLPIVFLTKNTKSQTFLKDGFIEGTHAIAGLDIFVSNIQSVPQLLLGGFGFSFSEVLTRTGHLGWFNTPVPPTTSIITFSIFLILITNSFRKWTKPTKRTVGFFSLTFLFLALFIHQKDKTVIGQDVQPRYFLVFVFIIFAFAVIQNRPHISVGTRTSFVFGMGVAHSFALHLLIKRYSVGYGDFGISLNSGIQWWALDLISPNTVWLVSSAAFAYFAHWSISAFSQSTEIDLKKMMN